MTRLSSSVVLPLYLGLTLAFTYPLVLDLSTAVPSDLGDPLLNAWILWWNAHAVPYTSTWWNAPAFYPAQGALAFSEHLLGISVISTPVQWLGGGPQLAYNAAFLLSFPLSAFATYLLVFELTGRRDAAFIAGLLFGFAPYRVAHFPHIQGLSSYWMPISLLGLHRYLHDRRVRWLAVFGAGWTLQALCNGYYLLFFSVLVALWVLWFVRPASNRRHLAAIASAWAIAAIPVLPLLWHYRSVHASYGFVRGFGEIHNFGADVAGLLDAAGSLALWGSLRVYHRAEGELFPGLTVALLVVAGAMTAGRADPDRSRARFIARRVLAVLAVVTGVVALSAIVLGPWQISVLGFHLLSVGNPVKPFTEMLLFGVALILISPRVVSAYRTGSALGFYAVAAFLMWLFSLGPAPTLLGRPFMYRAPYALLMFVPGFDSLRVPARFAMVTTLCLAVIGGILFDRLASRIGRGRLVLALIVAVGVIADGWMKKMPLERAPVAWAAESCAPTGQALMELPLGDPGRDVMAMYRAMSHDHPLVNGYSGYFPPYYAPLRYGLAGFEDDLLTQLARHGVHTVVVDVSAESGGNWKRYVSSHDGTTQLCSDDQHIVYQLGADRGGVTMRSDAMPLPISSLYPNVNADEAALMLDGDRSTRWQSGPQADTARVDIDLGSIRSVHAVVSSLGSFVDDFPRALAIEASEDGQRWNEAWRGLGGSLAFVGALEAPRDVPMTFTFPETRARFLRLRLLSNDPVYYWSVAELAVLGR